MGFDQEPESRHLLHHPENDHLFEIFHLSGLEECLDNGCDDVTGIPKWEKRFKDEDNGMVTKNV